MDFGGYKGDSWQGSFDSGFDSSLDNRLDSGFNEVSDEDFEGDLDLDLECFDSYMKKDEEYAQDIGEDFEQDLDFDLENYSQEEENEQFEDVLEADLDSDWENEDEAVKEEKFIKEVYVQADETNDKADEEINGEVVPYMELEDSGEEAEKGLELEKSEEEIKESKELEDSEGEIEENKEPKDSEEELKEGMESEESEEQVKGNEESEDSGAEIKKNKELETSEEEIKKDVEVEASEEEIREEKESEDSGVEIKEDKELETSEEEIEKDVEVEASEEEIREEKESEDSGAEIKEDKELEASEGEIETDVEKESAESEKLDKEIEEDLTPKESGEKEEEFKTPKQISEEMHRSIRETWMKGYNPEEQLGSIKNQQERMELYKQGLAEMGNLELSQVKELTSTEIVALYHSLQKMESSEMSSNLSQEVKIQKAYEEIKEKREREQIVYRKNLEVAEEYLEQDSQEWNRTFVTNDGRELTYKAAVVEVQRDAQGLLEQIEKEKDITFSAEIRDKLNEKILLSLAMQQKKTDQRGIGEHGVKHIYGNYQRTKNALSEQRPEVRLAGLISQIHHDEGYSTNEIHNSSDEKARRAAEKLHDVYSGEIFARNHEKFYQKIFGNIDDTDKKDLMYGIKEAIDKHNTSRPNEIKKHINPENKEGLSDEAHLVVSAVHISDKIALGEREKMAEFYETPEVASILQKVYDLDSMIKIKEPDHTQGNTKIYDYLKMKSDQAHEEIKYSLQDKLVQIINENESYPKELKKDFCEAVRKDVSQQSAKFVNSMNVVDTPPDALKYVKTNEGIKAEISLNAIDAETLEKSIGKNLVQRQFAKLFEDLGCSENVKEQLAAELLKNGKVELDEQNVVVNLRHLSLEEVRQQANEAGVLEKRLDVRQALENLKLHEYKRKDEIQLLNETNQILSKGKEKIDKADILVLKRCCNIIQGDIGRSTMQWINDCMRSSNYREAAYSLAIEMKKNILKGVICNE
ncbi:MULTISPECIES: putative sodium/potassium/calcium exchanger [Blautia]|uniref:hypothetical protein n=1 Tax=Blautia TaxID=572511 RepID=UPI000BA2F76C|nr:MULTISPECIES: hypothetical protein [Blautia]